MSGKIAEIGKRRMGAVQAAELHQLERARHLPTNCAPAAGQSGTPQPGKSSSITHWRNGSWTTASPGSTRPTDAAKAVDDRPASSPACYPGRPCSRESRPRQLSIRMPVQQSRRSRSQMPVTMPSAPCRPLAGRLSHAQHGEGALAGLQPPTLASASVQQGARSPSAVARPKC